MLGLSTVRGWRYLAVNGGRMVQFRLHSEHQAWTLWWVRSGWRWVMLHQPREAVWQSAPPLAWQQLSAAASPRPVLWAPAWLGRVLAGAAVVLSWAAVWALVDRGADLAAGLSSQVIEVSAQLADCPVGTATSP